MHFSPWLSWDFLQLLYVLYLFLTESLVYLLGSLPLFKWSTSCCKGKVEIFSDNLGVRLKISSLCRKCHSTGIKQPTLSPQQKPSILFHFCVHRQIKHFFPCPDSSSPSTWELRQEAKTVSMTHLFSVASGPFPAHKIFLLVSLFRIKQQVSTEESMVFSGQQERKHLVNCWIPSPLHRLACFFDFILLFYFGRLASYFF